MRLTVPFRINSRSIKWKSSGPWSMFNGTENQGQSTEPPSKGRVGNKPSRTFLFLPDENSEDFTALPSSKVKFAKDLNGKNLLALLVSTWKEILRQIMMGAFSVHFWLFSTGRSDLITLLFQLCHHIPCECRPAVLFLSKKSGQFSKIQDDSLLILQSFGNPFVTPRKGSSFQCFRFSI